MDPTIEIDERVDMVVLYKKERPGLGTRSTPVVLGLARHPGHGLF